MLRLLSLLLLLYVAPSLAHAERLHAPTPPPKPTALWLCEADSPTPPAPTDLSCRPAKFSELDPQGHELWMLNQYDIADATAFDARPLAVYSGALASRQIWWNGEEIASVGDPGATPAAETPGNLDAVTPIPSRLLRSGSNMLAVRFSSFHNAFRVHTSVHYVSVGSLQSQDRQLLKYYGASLATTGALVAAGLFFGLAFMANRRNLDPLLITLMSVCAVGQLWLESLRGFIDIPYPMQIWRLSAIAALATGFSLSMTAYVARRFTPKHWRLRVAAAATLILIASPFAPGFDGFTLFALLLPALVSLASAGQGLLAKRKGAILALVALLAFVALIFVGPDRFLDSTFYIAVSVLALGLFIDQAIALRRTQAEAADAKRRAALLELELLRRRIAPHFLMNTLNALSEWVESDPATGVKMIEALAGEFRLLSQISDRALIPLADEIALCRLHLQVMSYRVDRAFHLRTQDVDESIDVPPGVLHTLVENAFTHGRFANGAEFILRQTQEDGMTRLDLLAPQPEAPAPKQPGQSGQGLAYVRSRLEAAFGAAARLNSGAAPDGWLTQLVFPSKARPA